MLRLVNSCLLAGQGPGQELIGACHKQQTAKAQTLIPCSRLMQLYLALVGIQLKTMTECRVACQAYAAPAGFRQRNVSYCQQLDKSLRCGHLIHRSITATSKLCAADANPKRCSSMQVDFRLTPDVLYLSSALVEGGGR